MKQCARCSQMKEASEFYRARRTKDELSSWCKACHHAYSAEHHQARKDQPEVRSARAANLAAWRERNPKRLRGIDAKYRERRKNRVLEAYGTFCGCCGEDDPTFLSIDHVNNDGAQHRREIGVSGSGFYRWLINNDFPEGFRTLCFNCNMGRQFNGGICPHEEVVRGGLESA